MQARINRRQGRPIQDMFQKAWWGSQQRHASTGDFESKSLPERRTRDGKVAERKTKGILQRRHHCVRWGTAVDDSALRHGGASAAACSLCERIIIITIPWIRMLYRAHEHVHTRRQAHNHTRETWTKQNQLSVWARDEKRLTSFSGDNTNKRNRLISPAWDDSMIVSKQRLRCALILHHGVRSIPI